MLRGLALIVTSTPSPPAAPAGSEPPVRPLAHHPQFVRLLANMLLRTQSEVIHVY